MAFQQQTTITATEIRNITVYLKDAFDEQGTPYQSAHFQVQILMSDGRELSRRGDLVPHITPAQRQGLLDFMDSLRTQAANEILP